MSTTTTTTSTTTTTTTTGLLAHADSPKPFALRAEIALGLGMERRHGSVGLDPCGQPEGFVQLLVAEVTEQGGDEQDRVHGLKDLQALPSAKAFILRPSSN